MNYTLNAIKGQQWNKEVYITNIPFVQINEICRVDEEVQRKRDAKKIKDIAEYIEAGIIGERAMSGFSSIVTSLRYATVRYEESTNELKISTRGKLYISDGQHREGGIEAFCSKVFKKIEDARNENDVTAMEYWQNILEELEKITIPVVIFTNLTKEEEQQLFFDMNNLATPVNASQALKYDQNDKYNIIAKILEKEIPIIRKYGINKTAKALNEKNKEIATLKIWNNCMRILLNGPTDSDMKKKWNDSWEISSKKDLCLKFWDSFFSILPDGFNDKDKYIVTKSVYLQGVSAFGNKIINNFPSDQWRDLVLSLKNFDWSNTNNIYEKYGGGYLLKSKSRNGDIVEKFKFKGTRAAINSVSQALEEYTLEKVTE